MHTPSPELAAYSMTCLMQGCEVGHTPQMAGRVCVNKSAQTQRITLESTSAIWNRLWMLGSRTAPPQWITWPIHQSVGHLAGQIVVAHDRHMREAKVSNQLTIAYVADRIGLIDQEICQIMGNNRITYAQHYGTNVR